MNHFPFIFCLFILEKSSCVTQAGLEYLILLFLADSAGIMSMSKQKSSFVLQLEIPEWPNGIKVWAYRERKELGLLKDEYSN